MIDTLGTGSFVAFLRAGQQELIEVDGVYSFNRQYGLHVHDDGNATFQLICELPDGIFPHDVQGVAYNSAAGVIALLTDLGVYRTNYEAGELADWHADGEKL